MKTKLLTFLFALLSPAVLFAQGQQHDRIVSRGKSTFDVLANTQMVTLSGATPSITGGNVFKTSNGAPTTVTNFTGGVDSQKIAVICGDTNTTIQNNANIVNASGADVPCLALNQEQDYVFDASQSAWIQRNGQLANIGQIPNTPLAFSATPSFATTKNASYSMTLTGNVTSSTVTGTPTNGNLLSLTLTQDATGGRTFAFPGNFIFTPTFTFATTPLAINELTFKYDGTNWHLISNVGSGSGCTPLGTNALQKNNSGACAAANETDDGSLFATTLNARFKGPNPYIDVTAYGVRATSSVPQTTGSINSGTAALTVASGTGFQNGDGIVVRGAGTTNALSTPAAPTVANVSVGVVAVGGGAVNSSGSTTYHYCAAARLQNGALTACSPQTTTTTGAASLGLQTVNISSWTRTNNVVTVTTATNHNLVQFAQFTITIDSQIAGFWSVASVVDPTHFTFNTNIDARNGGSTSGGATGVVTFYLANRVIVAHVTNAWQYLIYGDASGSMALIGITYRDNTNAVIASDPLYNNFDDYGTTMTVAPGVPDWIPQTPPVSAKNGDLVTTIVSGGGTTSLTLAANASNTVASATVKFDNAPNIQTAATVAVGSGQQNGTLYFPATPNGQFYATSSFLTLAFFPSSLVVRQAGQLALGDTMQLAGTIWKGENALSSPSFAFSKYATISSGTAFPMVYTFNAVQMSDLSFTNFSNDGVIWQDDAGGNSIPGSKFERINFTSASATTDHTSHHMVIRNNINGGAGWFMDYVTMAPGATTATNSPLFVYTSTGGSPFSFSHIFLNRRGMYFGSGCQCTFDWLYEQGAVSPKIILNNNSGSVVQLDVDIRNSIEDTTFAPIVVYANQFSGQIKLVGTNGIVSFPFVTGPGGPATVFEATGSASFNRGQNMGAENLLVGNSIDGTLGGQNVAGGVKRRIDGHFSIGTPHSAFVESLPQAAPTCAVQSGGTIGIGTHTFRVAPVFGNAGEGSLSPSSAGCTTSSGNQTVQLTWATVPGAIGYDFYMDGFSGLNLAAPMVTPGSATGFTWNGSNSGGGSAPDFAASGPVGFNKSFAFAPNFVIENNFKLTLGAASLAAARTQTFMDLAGNVALIGGNHSLTAPFPRNNVPSVDAGGRLVTNVPPMSVFDSFTRANGTLQAGNANWTIVQGAFNIASNATQNNNGGQSQAAYTGQSFPADDMWVSAKIAVAPTSTTQIGVTARTSATANTAYRCMATVASLSLDKFVTGSFTSLQSVGSITWNVDDVITINTNGTTITCYINGVQVAQQTDASIGVGGFPGIWGFASGTGGFKAWAASAGGVSLNLPQSWAAIQTATAAGGFDANAATSLTAGLRMPNVAGANPTTAGALAYDSTNKNAHVGANGVDNIIPLTPTANSRTTTDCVNWNITSSVVTLGDAGAPCGTTTPSSSDTFTNKTFDAEGTGNTLTIPTKLFFRAALCNNGTAALATDASTASTVGCFGTTTKIGVWQAADADAITWSYLLTTDFTGNIDGKIMFNSPDTTGTVIFNIALACVDGTGATADDPAFNSSSAFGTVTLAAPANASWGTTVTNITKSGTTTCAAGSWLNIKVTRATDTGTSRVNFKSLELTARRAM